MKRFQFSLSKMRDYKKQLMESEKNRLIKLQSDRDNLVRMIKSLQSDYDKIHAQMAKEIIKGVTVMEVKMFQYRKDSIRREQQQLQTQVFLLDGAIERQRKMVVALSQEVSGLDKLEEKQKTEYNIMLAKEDELIISEFITSKFISQQTAVAAR